MSKYIDKGVLLERMNRTRPYEGEDGSFERQRRLQWLADIGQVNMCPAADVEEVRHGRWVRGDEMSDYPRVPYNPWETYCSCCGEIMEQSHDNFCGNCGAKMDGDTE